MYKICVSGVLQLTCKKEPIAKYFPKRVAKLVFFVCFCCFSGEIPNQLTLTHLAVHCLEAVKE